MRNIKIVFQYLDEKIINKLLMTVLHPKLEYAASLWLPSRVEYKEIRERSGSNNKVCSRTKRFNTGLEQEGERNS